MEHPASPNTHLADEWAAAAWKRFDLKIPVDVNLIRKGLHLYIRRKALPKKECGFLLETLQRHYIVLNETHSTERQTFTTAHEIGEYLLKRHLRRTDSKTPVGALKERFCNRFATNLLMPENKVREAAARIFHDKKSNDKTIALAHQFGVSVQAMNYRLCELEVNPVLSRHSNDHEDGEIPAQFKERLDAFAEEMKAMIVHKETTGK
jgi:Zn-dependent peptidase ImmA (M78 family)